MDFLRRIGRFIGGAAQNVGRAVQQAPRFISRGVQDAERARQQAVAQVQRNLPRFQAPPPPRIQLPQIQIPRVQAPKIDLGAVSRALSNYYGRTAASQVVPGIQRAIPQIDKNVQSFNERLLGGLGRTAIRTGEFVLPGKTENISEAAIRRLFPEAGSAAGRRGLTPLADPRSFGGRLGTGAKAAVDVAGIVLPSTAATKGLQATQLAQRGMQGGRLARLGTIAATEAVGGIPASLASIAQARGQQKPVDLKKEIGIGLAIDAATPLGIKLLGKGYKAVRGAISNVSARDLQAATKAVQAAPTPRPIAENVYPIKPGVGRVKPPAGSVVDATPGLGIRAQKIIDKTPSDVAKAAMPFDTFYNKPGNIQKYVLDAKGNPVGAITAESLNPRIARNTLKINNLYVTPKARTGGTGSKLLTELENTAKASGIQRIYLDSAQGVENFYIKNGYTKIPGSVGKYEKILRPEVTLPVRPQQAIDNIPQVPQKPIFETVPSSAMQPKAPKGQEALYAEARTFRNATDFANSKLPNTSILDPRKAELRKTWELANADVIAQKQASIAERRLAREQASLRAQQPTVKIQEDLNTRIKPYKLENKTIYHGTSADNTQNILKTGFKSSSELPETAFRGGGYGDLSQQAISFSTSPKQAAVFGSVANRGSVLESKLKSNANVVTIKGIDYAEDLNDIIPNLKAKNIDAVYLPGEKEVAVINKNAVKPTGKFQEFNAIDASKITFFGEKPTGRGFAPGTTNNIYENVPESAMRPKAPKGESTLADIQISTKPVVPKEPISAKAQEVKSQFLNRFDSIERFVRKIELERGTKLKPSENPMYYVKQFMGGGGIANYRIDNELTPMLKQTKNFDGLRQYLVARRMNELASRGIGKKANAAIAELTQKYGPDEIANFDRISTQLYQYQRNQLDQLLATGVISKQSYDNIIAKNQFYIPFNRVIPDVISDVTQSGQKISGAKKLASLKAIKGSEKDIIDPIESVIKNTYDVQATVAKQKVLNSLVALAPDEFKPLAKGAGLKAPAIELFADGKRVKLAADPELAKALNSMDEEQLNLVIRAMSLPAKTLRAGATSLNVAFALPNILRDQLSAAVNSKYGGIPMYDFVSGLASVIKKDDSYKKWILSGADQATLFAQDRTTLQRGVKDITGGLGFKAGKLVKSPLELFRIFGDLSEKGSRVGVFKRALKGAGKEGLNTEDALLTAMRESREATIDFAQRGSKMKAFNAMVPFLNARVQGTYKLIQSFKNRPVQTMMRGAAIASAPAAILFIHNNAEGNAEVYNEIPDYVKREYFVIVTGDKKTPFIKIPKGEVGKIFANPVESFMAAVKNDNPNWSDTAKSIADSFLPVGSISEPARFITDIGPTAVTVPYQVLSNYDVFRGQNIVGQYQKDLPAAQQFSKYNTETAKKLGELLNISPAQLEFALSGFTGGLGRQGLQVADIAQGQRPPVQELPVLSRFLGQEKDLSASAQEVYKQAEKAKQQKARENFAIKKALEKGDTSVLEGLDKATATRLKRTVEEEKIKENLNPLEKSLFSLSKDQLETMKNSEYKDSVEKVIALQESLKSKSNKERVPKIKKTLPKQKRWGKKGRKAKVAKVKIPRPRKVSVTGVPKTPKITLAKVSTKGIKPKATARKSIKIKTG